MAGEGLRAGDPQLLPAQAPDHEPQTPLCPPGWEGVRPVSSSAMEAGWDHSHEGPREAEAGYSKPATQNHGHLWTKLTQKNQARPFLGIFPKGANLWVGRLGRADKRLENRAV